MEEKVFETRLEMLLIGKDFKDLTSDERAYVLNSLSEEEYRTYSFLMAKYKSALLSDYDKLQPSPKITGALAQAFNRKTANLKRVFFFEKPLYQHMAAAAMVIVAGFIYFAVHINKNEKLLTTSEITPNKDQRKEIFPPVTHDRQLAETTVTLEAKPAKIHSNRMIKGPTNRNLCIDVSDTSIEPSANFTEPTTPCLNPLNTMVNSAMVNSY